MIGVHYLELPQVVIVDDPGVTHLNDGIIEAIMTEILIHVTDVGDHALPMEGEHMIIPTPIAGVGSDPCQQVVVATHEKLHKSNQITDIHMQIIFTVVVLYSSEVRTP